MKELDQRNKDELLFRCSCGGNHFVSFEIFNWDISEPHTKEFIVEVIDRPFGLWDRIKRGLKFIFKGGDIYYCDVRLTAKDLAKVGELIVKYLNSPVEEEKDES